MRGASHGVDFEVPRRRPLLPPAVLLVAIGAALAAVPPGRRPMPTLDWEPPQVPDEIRMSGTLEQTIVVRPYGRAAMKETWSAGRTDYDAQTAIDRYQEYFDWLREKKARLESHFESASDRGAIQAARDLFEFGVEAEDRKYALEEECLFTGQWEGDWRVESNLASLGIESLQTAKMEAATKSLNPGARGMPLALTGQMTRGKIEIKADQKAAGAYGLSAEEKMEFSAGLAGIFHASQGVFFRAQPSGVKGRLKASLDLVRGGKLSAAGGYAAGEWTYRFRWPGMEALINALEQLTGRPPTEFPLKDRGKEAESDVLAPFEVEGDFSWIPPPLPPLKEEYFMLWFDTFWQVLHEEIGRASDLPAKAVLAFELFKTMVVPAFFDLNTHAIGQSAADHCRLWSGRAGSSLDASFEEWFRFRDAWHEEKIAQASDQESKKTASREKLGFAIEATYDFDSGLLSEDLKNRLGLKLQEAGSYIDRCFTGYFGYHNRIWAEKLERAAGPEARESVAWDYFLQAASMIEYAFHDVLSEKLLLDLEIKPWTENFYADDCFRLGWASGTTRFETALAGVKDGPRRDALQSDYWTWLLGKESLVYGSLASQALQAEVQATREKWER